jgi:hypothetical protein
VESSRASFPAPTHWADRLVLWGAEWEEWHGVPVAFATFRDLEDLRARAIAALGLVAAYAPADLARLRMLVRGVVVAKLHGAHGQWRQSLRICVLRTDDLRSPTHTTERIAATIVHELMHARLEARGFVYQEQNRHRIERICFRASRRFLEKLPDSTERTAALSDMDDYLAYETGVWQVVLGRDYLPWPVRAISWVFRQVHRLTTHRGAST